MGDPLLFTVHQTVLASLYNDTLSVDFLGREEGDAEQAENLTLLAQFDYDAMKKSQIDYDWDWDTCFFGWSLVLFMEFDRKTKTPMPEVIDPFTVLRDPNAVSPNGDVRGRGAARFLGREMRMCKYQMKKAGVYKHIDGLKCDEDKVGNEPLQQAVRERQQAQGYTEFKAEKLEGDSEEHILLEWFTVWNGERNGAGGVLAEKLLKDPDTKKCVLGKRVLTTSGSGFKTEPFFTGVMMLRIGNFSMLILT